MAEENPSLNLRHLEKPSPEAETSTSTLREAELHTRTIKVVDIGDSVCDRYTGSCGRIVRIENDDVWIEPTMIRKEIKGEYLEVIDPPIKVQKQNLVPNHIQRYEAAKAVRMIEVTKPPIQAKRHKPTYEDTETQKGNVCHNLSSESGPMRDLARKAFKEAVEYGAAITADWKLGEPIKGKPHQVSIPRPADGKGSYHTHFVEAKPSLSDFWEMLLHQEQAMCIGKAKFANPEVQCSFPQRPGDFQSLGLVVQGIQQRLDTYSKGLEEKYGKAIARTEMERLEGFSLLRSVRGLKDTLERRVKDIVADCQMESTTAR